jgi:hypothetical protein
MSTAAKAGLPTAAHPTFCVRYPDNSQRTQIAPVRCRRVAQSLRPQETPSNACYIIIAAIATVSRGWVSHDDGTMTWCRSDVRLGLAHPFEGEATIG